MKNHGRQITFKFSIAFTGFRFCNFYFSEHNAENIRFASNHERFSEFWRKPIKAIVALQLVTNLIL